MQRVLIVEDDAAIRNLLAASIERAGMGVSSAADGEEGLAILERENDFGVVLVDLHMPRIDGYQFLEKLALRAPPKPVAIVMTAAADAPGRAVPSNAQLVVQKPFDLALLLEMVGNALRNANANDAAATGLLEPPPPPLTTV